MESPVVGCLLGTAIGDALGLPLEGLNRRRAEKLFPGPVRHRLILGRGFSSDDTEHTIMVLQAYWASPDDPERFAREYARRLMGWMLMLPAAAGLATLKAGVRLLVGVPPSRSGVRSAGNGAAMRSAILGVVISDPEQRTRFVDACARVTHTDDRAIEGARLVALAAASTPADDAFWRAAAALAKHPEWDLTSVRRGELPKGPVSGYVISTVHAALACWVRHPNDYFAAITEAIELGGDTDTVGAIVGGIVGASAGVPPSLLKGYAEWPRGEDWLRRLAAGPVRTNWAAVLLRNALFLFVVLGHGFRRLLPPY